MITPTYRADHDAAERFILAAADGHLPACIRIVHIASADVNDLLAIMFTLTTLIIRLAQKIGGDKWHGVLRATFAEMRRDIDRATGA